MSYFLPLKLIDLYLFSSDDVVDVPHDLSAGPPGHHPLQDGGNPLLSMRFLLQSAVQSISPVLQLQDFGVSALRRYARHRGRRPAEIVRQLLRDGSPKREVYILGIARATDAPEWNYRIE